MKILSKLNFLRYLKPLQARFSYNELTCYITTQTELDALVALMRQHKVAAIDTEFTRKNTYYPILSIIQIAVRTAPKKKEFYIIDCLADLDLRGFFAVVNSPDFTKILHSALQDLQIFHQKSQLLPNNILDTQIMANLCGISYNIGYSGLVHNLFKRKLNKDQQMSNWQKRPLSANQIDYALCDVAYLEEISEKCADIIKKKGRSTWYEEEINNFIKKALFRNDENLVKRLVLKGKTPQQIFHMSNLVVWREKNARILDIPRQHLLRDEIIERWVDKQDEELLFPKRFTPEMQEEIRNILSTAGEFEVKELHQRMTTKQKQIFEDAKKVIHKIAKEQNIESQFILSIAELKQLVCHPEFFDEKVTGLRRELIGAQIANLIKN